MQSQCELNKPLSMFSVQSKLPTQPHFAQRQAKGWELKSKTKAFFRMEFWEHSGSQWWEKIRRTEEEKENEYKFLWFHVISLKKN